MCRTAADGGRAERQTGGCLVHLVVEEAHPDFTDIQDIFQTWRAMSFYVSKKQLLDNQRDKRFACLRYLMAAPNSSSLA